MDSSLYPALKAAILADPVLSSQPMTSAGAEVIAKAFNTQASPAFTVWRSNVSITETGKQFVGNEWAGMTSANHTRLQTVAQWLEAGYDASKADIRAMFDDIWSGAGGVNTRARLLALWKRLATRGEKLYATGTGERCFTGNPRIRGSNHVERCAAGSRAAVGDRAWQISRSHTPPASR